MQYFGDNMYKLFQTHGLEVTDTTFVTNFAKLSNFKIEFFESKKYLLHS